MTYFNQFITKHLHNKSPHTKLALIEKISFLVGGPIFSLFPSPSRLSFSTKIASHGTKPPSPPVQLANNVTHTMFRISFYFYRRLASFGIVVAALPG